MFHLEARSTTGKFSAILRDSIAEGMKSVMGSDGAEATLFHMGLSSFDDPEEFHAKLSAIFGFGTASVERVILQRLYQEMGFQPASMKEGDFVSQVELARRSLADAALRRGATG